jgi:hypothetical protein
VFDERPGNEPPVGFEYDLTLVKPAAAEIVEDVRCPLPGLGWLSEPDWKTLQGENGSKIKFLAAEAHESEIITNDGPGYCQVCFCFLFFASLSFVFLFFFFFDLPGIEIVQS